MVAFDAAVLNHPVAAKARQRCRVAMWALVVFWTLSTVTTTLTPEVVCKTWIAEAADKPELCSMDESPALFMTLRVNAALCALLAAILCTQASQGIWNNHHLNSAAMGLLILALTHAREAYLLPSYHNIYVAGACCWLYMVCALVFFQTSMTLKRVAHASAS